MKEYRIKFWINDNQLPSGGYETAVSVEEKTLSSARKKAYEICNSCAFGEMYIIRIERI